MVLLKRKQLQAKNSDFPLLIDHGSSEIAISGAQTMLLYIKQLLQLEPHGIVSIQRTL